MEKAWPSIVGFLVGFLILAGACQDSTGLHIVARVGDLQYDELRLGVARMTPGEPMGGAGAHTLVDPDTKGRYLGPFKPGDQDVYVYVADEADGDRALCTLSAMRGGAIVGEGRGETVIKRHVMMDVVVVMAGPGVDPTGQGGAGGSGQGTGAAGGAGTGAPPPKVANGQRCNTKDECISDRCADGVCCESDCAGACLSCAQPAMEGLCRPVPPGSDPRGICADKGAASCKMTGLCDVSGHCANYPAGTICAAATCKKEDELMPQATCDGAGHCQAPSALKCPLMCAAGVCL